MGTALFFGWQMGSLIGYWRAYGWPWTGALRRWADRRYHKRVEAFLATWAEQCQEEAHRLEAHLASIALVGVTFEEAADAFVALGQELKGSP
jgi:hypothetical protein